LKLLKSFDYLDVMWDEVSKATICQWKTGYVGNKIREGLETGLELFKQYRPDAEWIGDTTNLGVIGDADQDWINKDWFPRFLSTGGKYMAVVVPKSILSKMAVEAIMQKVEGMNLTMKYFDSLTDAQKWMQGVRK
jgi:hypothetical protein